MSTKRARSRSAFAAVTAITLLALVGVVIASLATSFALDAKRTAAGANSAQLRQLLLAGAASVVARFNHAQQTPPPSEWNVDLPPSLVDQQASLNATVSIGADGASATAEVHASFAGREAMQTVTLKRTADRWTVMDARLE